MNAVPPSFAPAPDAPRSSAQGWASVTGIRWAALGDAGKVVAMLAGIEPERPTPELRNFPALIRDADPWRRERAEHGIADLAAVMEPGITALLAVNARGADSRPAAMALWREFVATRAAIVSLLPVSGNLGPRRPA